MSRANFHKYKKLIFITIAATIFTAGLLLIRAAGNRGDAPYLYMKFDEGYGSTAHDEQGNVDGTITGATWANEDDCKTGKCLYYDGSGDYVSIPDFSLE